MPSSRFTAWLAEDEREALHTLAGRIHNSENLILRMAVRSLVLGKPVPGWLAAEARAMIEEAGSEATGNGR